MPNPAWDRVEQLRAENDALAQRLAEAERVADYQMEAANRLLKLRDAAEGRATRAEAALRYIQKPSVGFPGQGDIVDFVTGEALEQNVRLALATCIRQARAALTPTEEPGEYHRFETGAEAVAWLTAPTEEPEQ